MSHAASVTAEVSKLVNPLIRYDTVEEFNVDSKAEHSA